MLQWSIYNPPFGREWKNKKRIVEEEAKRGFAGRFGAGLPAASDGQMHGLMKRNQRLDFTRYFYKYEVPQPSAEIMAEILELKKELEGSLKEIF